MYPSLHTDICAREGAAGDGLLIPIVTILDREIAAGCLHQFVGGSRLMNLLRRRSFLVLELRYLDRFQIYSFTREIDWASRESQRAFLHVAFVNFAFTRTIIRLHSCHLDWQSAYNLLRKSKIYDFIDNTKFKLTSHHCWNSQDRTFKIASRFTCRSRDRYDGKTYFWRFIRIITSEYCVSQTEGTTKKRAKSQPTLAHFCQSFGKGAGLSL